MRTMSAYEQLLSRLSGGDRDFWDRPDGSWGERQREEVLGEAETERRADANSAYVIGSKALRRDELDNARAWFAVAADAEHPGAAFRSALAAARSAAQEDVRASCNLLRTAPQQREAEVRRWLRVAADWGHGDARHLVGTLSESGEGSRPRDRSGYGWGRERRRGARACQAGVGGGLRVLRRAAHLPPLPRARRAARARAGIGGRGCPAGRGERDGGCG